MTTKKIELKISITTDAEFSPQDDWHLIQQSNEQAVFQLMTIFNFIKSSARMHESDAEGEVRRFLSDLSHASSFGYALADFIWGSIDEFTLLQKEPEPRKTVAEMLSFLITSESVPKYISDGISQVMMDFFNEEVDQTEFNEETYSPEHIERLLLAYKRNDES